jgi:hypothetical protein
MASIVFQDNSMARTTENTISNSNSIVVLIFVAAGTCLPIRFLETRCTKRLFINLLHSNGFTRHNIVIK